MSPSPAVDTHLRTVLRQLPASPGVYLMKAADGRVLYVGKADVLRNRVRSYFGSKAGLDSRIVRMVSEVADVEYIVTDTISEAFLLENNLIKEHRPRFNIRLRDDKTLPVREDHPGRGLPAHRAHPEAREGRQPLLRPVREREQRRRDAEAAPQDLPVPDL